eukprot:jgi/Botrbrau1/882/Bobra.0167s0007.1
MGFKFFDSHCHLQDPRVVQRVETILQESFRDGVLHLACNGCYEGDWAKVLDLSVRYTQIVPNFGLHPWWVGQQSPNWLETLKTLLQKVPHAGLGECGLDKLRAKGDGSSLQQQEEAFLKQLRLGKELRRPISVHCVGAYGQLEEAVRGEAPYPHGLILHSWAGSREMLASLSRHEGVHFSLSGHSLRLQPSKLKAMLQQVPLDRLLLETDSPDGLPKLSEEEQKRLPRDSWCSELYQQGLNQPSNIRFVLERVAECMEREQQEIAAAAFRNSYRLFFPTQSVKESGCCLP